jgi:hypothetical protein
MAGFPPPSLQLVAPLHRIDAADTMMPINASAAFDEFRVGKFDPNTFTTRILSMSQRPMGHVVNDFGKGGRVPSASSL